MKPFICVCLYTITCTKDKEPEIIALLIMYLGSLTKKKGEAHLSRVLLMDLSI